MYSGKLQKVKFWYKGKSIEAVLDRLPTARVIEENETGNNNANTIHVSNKIVKKAISKQKEPRLVKIMRKAKINTGNNFYGNIGIIYLYVKMT